MANLLTLTNVTIFIILCGGVALALKVLFDHSNKRWKIIVEIGHTSDNSILIAATNIGYENVTFSLVGFILPNNKLSWNPLDVQKYQIPYTLHVGKSITMPQGTPKQLAIKLKDDGYSGKIKLRGFFKIDTDIILKSKSFDFDIEKALGKPE